MSMSVVSGCTVQYSCGVQCGTVQCTDVQYDQMRDGHVSNTGTLIIVTWRVTAARCVTFV